MAWCHKNLKADRISIKLGGNKARWAQEGCRRLQTSGGRRPKGTVRKESRLRVHQEEGGGGIGPHTDQQNIQRSDQRQLEEAIRECRNICGTAPRVSPALRVYTLFGRSGLIWMQTYIGHVLVSVNPFRDCRSKKIEVWDLD